MSVLQNITSHLSREDFSALNLWFHQNNHTNGIDITKKTDEEIAKMFLSTDRDTTHFIHDFVLVKKVLEDKGLQCTHTTRLALAKELGMTDYALGRMEYASLNKDTAREYYKRALEADTQQEHPDLIIEYANMLVSIQKYAEAEKIYDLVIKGPSKEWGFAALNKLGNLYYQQAQYGNAEVCYLESTNSENIATKQEAHANLAAIYKQVMEGKIQL